MTQQPEQRSCQSAFEGSWSQQSGGNPLQEPSGSKSKEAIHDEGGGNIQHAAHEPSPDNGAPSPRSLLCNSSDRLAHRFSQNVSLRDEYHPASASGNWQSSSRRGVYGTHGFNESNECVVMPAAGWSWLKSSIPPDWFFLNLKSRQSFWFPIDARSDFASLNLPNQLEGQAVSLDFAYTRCHGLTGMPRAPGSFTCGSFTWHRLSPRHSHQNFPEYQARTYADRMLHGTIPSRWDESNVRLGSQLRRSIWIDRRFPLIGWLVPQPQAASPILSCAIRSRTKDGQEAMPNSRCSPRARNCTAAESVSASMARSSTAHRRQSAADCTSWLR